MSGSHGELVMRDNNGVRQKALTNHGHSHKGAWTPTYYSWAAMMSRCTNPARNVYAIYGGRGIRVCERWRTFANFLADMGERPEGTSLGRVNADGNYEPGNCEWQDATKQSRTRRNNKVTPEIAAEIRRLRCAGISYPRIGAQFGISKTMARNISIGRAWI